MSNQLKELIRDSIVRVINIKVETIVNSVSGKKTPLPFQLPKILLRSKGYKSKTSSKIDMYSKRFKYVTDGNSFLKEKHKNKSFVNARGGLKKLFVVDLIKEGIEESNSRNKCFERQKLLNNQFKNVSSYNRNRCC